MIEGIWLWLAFMLLFCTTLMTRGSFIVMGKRARLPLSLQNALRFAPVAALSALIVPDLFIDQGVISPVNPKILAGIMVVIITLKIRNPWLPFVIGMATLLVTRYEFSVEYCF